VFKTGPYMSSVDPNRGEGSEHVFTAEFSLGNNGVGISQARLHFQEQAEGRADRCVVRYDPGSKSFYLLSDQPGKYLGPIAAGGNASLWNSRCFLAGCSKAEVTGDMLKVHFAIRFNEARFARSHNMLLEMVDRDRHASPAPMYGQWRVPAESTGATSEWPSDRSCPTPTPVAPLGVYTASAVNCKDVSGPWSDPNLGGTWSLKSNGREHLRFANDHQIGMRKCLLASDRSNEGTRCDPERNLPQPRGRQMRRAPCCFDHCDPNPDCKTGSVKVEVQK
jgi:hypothetical protein